MPTFFRPAKLASATALLSAACFLMLAFPALAQTVDDPSDGDVTILTASGNPDSAAMAPRQTFTDRWYNLTTQRGQDPANQYYYGTVQLITTRTKDESVSTKFYVEAVAVPLNNPYTVSVTRKSDGASVVIGRMNVHNSSDLDLYKRLPADLPDTFQDEVEARGHGLAVFGGDNPKRALPAGFDGNDVATVTLTDSQGVARLAGEPQTADFDVRRRGVMLRLAGDPANAPRATAEATGVRRFVRDYSERTFHLSARRLPASTAVTILADGVALGQFTTGPNGRLLVAQGHFDPERTRTGKVIAPQKLSTGLDLSRTRIVTLTDAQGNVLASSKAE